MKKLFLLLFLLVSLLLSEDTPLNCSPSNSQKVVFNEIYHGGGGNGNLEFLEIYFLETTDIKDWKIYFNDGNSYENFKLGYHNNSSSVLLPDGTTTTDDNCNKPFCTDETTFPKGTFISYDVGKIDPTDGEILLVDTSDALNDNDTVVIDHFVYYKNSSSQIYTTPIGCSTPDFVGSDSNRKDFSRLTDGSGDFFQEYPSCTGNGNSCNIDITQGASNLGGGGAEYFTTDVTIAKEVNSTNVFVGEQFAYTITLTNEGDYTATTLNLTDILDADLELIGSTTTCFGASPCGDFDTTTNSWTLYSLPQGEEASVELKVKALNTGNIENSATVSIDQQDPDNNSASAPTVTVAPPKLFISSVINSVDEDGGVLSLSIELDTPLSTDVNFDINGSDITALKGSDYSLTEGTYTIPAGEKSIDVDLSIIDENTYETDETFKIEIFNPVGAEIREDEGNLTITIVNDDPIPLFSITDVTEEEGEAQDPKKEFTFQVSLANPSYQEIRITYATTDGSGKRDLDYEGTFGTLIFAPGETEKEINVPIIGNDITEPNKEFYVDLIAYLNTSPTKTRGVGTIVNDDDNFSGPNWRPFSLVYSANKKGNIRVIGNSVMCENDNGDCADPGDNTRNNNINVKYVKIDTSADAPVNSASAELDLINSSEILWAGLYWQGFINNNDDLKSDAMSIKLKIPGDTTYRDIDAEVFNWTYHDGNSEKKFYYQGFKDITSIINKTSPNGTYIAGGIDATQGKPSGGASAGWSIAVAYKNASMSMKNIAVFDGFIDISGNGVDATKGESDAYGRFKKSAIKLSGFLTPNSTPIESTFLWFAGEGDVSARGDELLLTDSSGVYQNVFDSINPKNDIANSRISYKGALVTTRDPNYTNAIGIDINDFDISTILDPCQNTTTVQLTSSGDGYFPGMFAFATEITTSSVCYNTGGVFNIVKESGVADFVDDGNPAGENSLLTQVKNGTSNMDVIVKREFKPNSVEIDHQTLNTEFPYTGIIGIDFAKMDDNTKTCSEFESIDPVTFYPVFDQYRIPIVRDFDFLDKSVVARVRYIVNETNNSVPWECVTQDKACVSKTLSETFLYGETNKCADKCNPDGANSYEECISCAFEEYSNYNCSSDVFAVRPDRFDISTTSSEVKVSEQLIFTIKALNPAGIPTENYNEILNINNSSRSPNLDVPTGVSVVDKTDFTDGVATVTLQFDSGGSQKITIEENIGSNASSGEWGYVDQSDTEDSARLINSDEISVTVGYDFVETEIAGDYVIAKRTKGKKNTPIGDDGYYTQIEFKDRNGNPFTFSETPVVIISDSDQGYFTDSNVSTPAHIRIKDVTTTGFKAIITEPQGEDGSHNYNFDFSYIAINKGIHSIGSEIFYVGTVNTQKVQGKNVPSSFSEGWSDIESLYQDSNHMILSTIQTMNNENGLQEVCDPICGIGTSSPFLYSNVKYDNNKFQGAMELAETTDGSISFDEEIGYIIGKSDVQGSFLYEGETISFETISKDKFEGWDDGCKTEALKNSYDSLPLILGSKNDIDGGDGGWSRSCQLSDTEVGFVIDEDRANDDERAHTTEDVNVLVLSGVYSNTDRADLYVTGTDDVSEPRDITTGDEVTLTINVSNYGIDMATGTEVRLTEIDWLNINTVTPSIGTYSNGIWSIGDLNVGEDATLTITFSPKSSANGSKKITGEIVSNLNDPDSSDNAFELLYNVEGTVSNFKAWDDGRSDRNITTKTIEEGFTLNFESLNDSGERTSYGRFFEAVIIDRDSGEELSSWASLIIDTNLSTSNPDSLNLTPTKASRNAAIQVRVDLGNGLENIILSNDYFAILPQGYSSPIDKSSITSESTDELVLSAVSDFYNNTNDFLGYNQEFGDLNITVNGWKDESDETIPQVNINNLGTFSVVNGSGVFGVDDMNLTFNDVGVMEISIIDEQWAIIDEDDTPYVDRILTTTLNTSFIPSHFVVSNTSFRTFPDSNYTFFNSNVSEHNATLNFNVAAKGKEGSTTENYSQGLFAKDISASFYFTTDTSNALDLNYIVTGSSQQNISDFVGEIVGATIPSSQFSNGVAQIELSFNFERDHQKAIEPLIVTRDISNDTIYVEDSSNNLVSGENNISDSDSVLFLYGRVNPIDSSAVGTTVNAKIYYEVYGTIKPSMVTKESKTSINWWIISSTDEIEESMLTKFDGGTPTVGSIDNSNDYDLVPFSYSEASKIRVEIDLTGKEFLFYHPYSSTTEERFYIEFLDSTTGNANNSGLAKNRDSNNRSINRIGE